MAKFYYAKKHVNVGPFVARPGEVIEGEFSEEDLNRWFALDAIAECGEPEGVSDDEVPESFVSSDDSADIDDADDIGDAEQGLEDVDAAPATIDVMDGITAAPKAPKTTRKAKEGKAK